MIHLLEPRQAEHRNFNICPHCEWLGKDATLYRLSEGIPMISRSDGRSFHLLLADRPLPYPVESEDETVQRLSLCFWYACDSETDSPKSTLVLVPGPFPGNANIFRRVEFVADLLARQLLAKKKLAGFYELNENSLHELSY